VHITHIVKLYESNQRSFVALSGPTTRRRDLTFSLGRGTVTILNSNGSKTVSPSELGSIQGKQITVSEGHPFASQKGSGGALGGEFFTQKNYVEASNASGTVFKHKDIFPGVWRETTYSGPIYPCNPNSVGGFPPQSISSNSELDAWGAKAIANCKPTNSVADASTFLGELHREALPHLIGSQTWKARTLTTRNAGHEYLNVVFGWLPLVHDIRSFANAVHRSNTVLEQYERDAGGVVRRKYHFPTKTSTVESVIQVGAVPYGPNTTDAYSTDVGDLVRTRETVQERWFSGAFTYHLPNGNDYRSGMIRDALRAKKLLGIIPTPSTLWNLAPWSWATDWFLNTGDVISNLTDWATDGLVMRYGYMMEHTIVRDTYTLTKPGLSSPGVRVQPLTLVTETKMRRKANPFGFGLTWSGLSPRQTAIAVALGLTRGK